MPQCPIAGNANGDELAAGGASVCRVLKQLDLSHSNLPEDIHQTR